MSRILIVTSNPAEAVELTNKLKQYEYDVTTVTSADAAFGELLSAKEQGNDYQVVISAHQLGEVPISKVDEGMRAFGIEAPLFTMIESGTEFIPETRIANKASRQVGFLSLKDLTALVPNLEKGMRIAAQRFKELGKH